MKLLLQVSDTQSLSVAVEPDSSEGPDRAARCENTEREPEAGLEDDASRQHMNVIVKEEEEEEALCGTSLRSAENAYDACFYISDTLILSLVFPPAEEAQDQVSASEDCTIQEEAEKQQQESNTDIRITVKEEEEEPVNSKQGALMKYNFS